MFGCIQCTAVRAGFEYLLQFILRELRPEDTAFNEEVFDIVSYRFHGILLTVRRLNPLF
jgi:hypothetical protein